MVARREELIRSFCCVSGVAPRLIRSGLSSALCLSLLQGCRSLECVLPLLGGVVGGLQCLKRQHSRPWHDSLRATLPLWDRREDENLRTNGFSVLKPLSSLNVSR
ncbi:unnamed protein product [Aphanomyces euteiches]|nr:hypothetical protein AeRB84_010666 [Aphanomyces euteiches]